MAFIKANFILLYFTTQWWILENFLINAQSYPYNINSKTSNSYRRQSSNNGYSYGRIYPSNSNNAKSSVTTTTTRQSVRNSKFLGIPSDVPENSKFLGIGNHEQNEERFFHNHKHHKHQNKRRRQQKYQRPAINYDPCVADRRNQQGRFLWDINIYNVYPSNYQQQSNGIECEEYQNTNTNEDDHQQQDKYDRPRPILQAWSVIYNLIRPGGPLNPRPQRPPGGGISGGGGGGGSGSNGYRPSNSGSSSNSDGSNGDIYDPVYDDRPVYENIANDFSTPRPFSPGEIVGSIANTVNGVIQTISGNRPAYYRRRRYY